MDALKNLVDTLHVSLEFFIRFIANFYHFLFRICNVVSHFWSVWNERRQEFLIRIHTEWYPVIFHLFGFHCLCRPIHRSSAMQCKKKRKMKWTHVLAILRKEKKNEVIIIIYLYLRFAQCSENECGLWFLFVILSYASFVLNKFGSAWWCAVPHNVTAIFVRVWIFLRIFILRRLCCVSASAYHRPWKMILFSSRREGWYHSSIHTHTHARLFHLHNFWINERI